MIPRQTRFHTTLLLAGLLTVSMSAQRQHAPDGVTINDEGLPQYSTFSLCAIDPATGQSGAAVTTRVPFVGRAVPHVRAGVGAVCTQASTVVEYGPRGLDLLAKGVEPKEVLAQLLATDEQRESRQVGVIDMKGRSAAHTGKNNGNWAGSRQGKNYTVQANIMVGPEVVEAVATTFEASDGTGMPLAERMILALEAGYAKGGDRRWGNLQSAAIKVADPNDPGRGNDHITLAIEVGENAEPVAEMKRIYYTTGRRLGYRSFSRIEGPDVIELKRMLHDIGYWRPSLAAFPETPRRMTPEFMREYGTLDDEAIAAVDRFRKDRGLDYQGDAPGFVDTRFIASLRTAYYDVKKGGAKPTPTPGTHASGAFDVKLTPVAEGRMSAEKHYHGDLDATATAEMLTAMTSVKDSASYVAVERVSGTLHGRRGTFLLQHSATMTRGAQQLSVTVVPDSATGELTGLAGAMTIVIAPDGKHSYEFDYSLPAPR